MAWRFAETGPGWHDGVTMSCRALIVYSPGYRCDLGGHVFPTRKYEAVRDSLLQTGLAAPDSFVDPQPATREALLLVHGREYLEDLEQLRWSLRTQPSEMPLTAEIVNAYVLAAGGTTLAARLALECGFAVHLGGGFHHASADRAEGFCYINDLAVAIRTLRHEGRIARAAVVDLDVHQGNGTAHIFETEEAVFTLSLHQEENYPVPKAHSDLDVGLEDGTGDELYLARLAKALERVWAFRPDLLLYQAGADPYVHDQLGGLALSFEGLERRDRAVLEGCARRGLPAAVTLGGGYARDTADTVRIHATTCALALACARSRSGARS